MGEGNHKSQRLLLNCVGHSITAIYSGCKITNGAGHISMGKGSYCNSDCFFDMNDDIVIGRNVSIGMRCTFITTSHEIGATNKRAGKTMTAPIKIEDGCWVGAGTTILPGITIGRGAVVGTGSLVTHDLEPDGLYYGRPAKLVKKLDN